MTNSESRKCGLSTVLHIAKSVRSATRIYIMFLLPFSGILANRNAAIEYIFPFTEDLGKTEIITTNFENSFSLLEEECGDGIDNDSDGMTDCEDDDCGPQITNVQFTVPTACDATDGSISISVTGGLPPYRFSIDNGLTWQTNSGNYTNVTNDTYNIRVSNADGTCIKAYPSIDVNNPDSPILDSVIVEDPSLCFLNNGTLDIFARGTGLEYSIDGGNTFSSQANYTGLAAGVYRVRVRKGECVVSHPNVFIIEPKCASNIAIPSGNPAERCLWRLNEQIILDIEGSIGSGFDDTYVLTTLQGVILDVSGTPALAAQPTTGIYIAFILGVETGTTINGLTVSSYIQEVDIESLCYEWSEGFLLELCPTTETDCFDGIDNDGDGMTDCEDDDCSPMFMSINKTDPSDCNLNNGSITVSVAGGQGIGYVYSIDNGQTWQNSPTFTNLAGGLYLILAANSDETCPRISPDVILDTPIPPTVLNVLSGNSTSCETANGSITVIASGAVGLNYSIDGGTSYQSENQFTGLGGGTYQIRVQNNDGTCIISEDDVQLSDPVEPVINGLTANSPSACGAEDGSITINATGSSIEYSINAGNTYSPGNTFTGLTEGTYNIAVRNDDGSCKVLSTANPVSLTSGAVVAITNVTANHPSSCNGTQGQIEITATGSSTLQYSIDNSSNFQTSNVFANLPAGDYSIIVSNSDGSCPESYPTISLVEESAGSIQSVNATDPTDCGLSDGTIAVNATEGSANLEYRLDNGPWQSGNTFSNMPSGNYQVSIRNVGGNCEVAGQSTSITDPVAPNISGLAFTNDVRCDSDNGTITILVSGTVGLEYSIDGRTTWSSENEFTDLSAGDYPTAVRNANGSCQVDYETVSIIENISSVSVSLAKSDPLCYGDQNGSISPTMQGGVEPYAYAWSNGSDAASLSGMGTGSYSLTVTDANGCTNEASTSLTEPPVLTSSAVSQDDQNCNNCLIITALGGTSPYEYSADGINFQTNNTISELPGGMYTVMVKDASECTSTYEIELIDLNPLSCSITLLNEISCIGGSDASFEVNIQDGEAPFEYSLDSENWGTEIFFSGLLAGDYTLYVRDNAGNNSSCTINIADSENEVQASASVVNHESCFNHKDGRISVQATGGQGTLQYSIDGENFQTEAIFENLAAGNYTITVKDENDCSAISQATIDAAPDLYCQIVVNEGVSCFGNNDGRLVAEATGGAGNIVFTLNGETSTTGEFTNLASGSYLLQITDGNSCFSTCAAIVAEGAQLTCNVNQKSDVSCAGAADGFVQFSLEGGQGVITYHMGEFTNSTGLFEGLSGGEYIIVASDESGCISNCSVTIEEADLLTCEISSSQNISCFGEGDGSFSAAVKGGAGTFSYSLNGAPIGSPIITGLEAGDYTFTVQDENDCSSQCEISISEPNELTCTATVLSHVICDGGNEGSVRINVLGGVGSRTITLNGESNATGIFENLSAGSYTVTVADENGCVTFCDFEIVEPGELRCSIEEFENISCKGAQDGSITVGVTGGMVPFSYSIDGINFGTSNQFNNLAPGFYIINVRDANGCRTSCSKIMDEPSPLQCIINEFVDVNCSDESNGRIVVSGTGGTAPYQYSLNNAAFVSSGIFDNLGAGSYNVRVQDSYGCLSVCDLQVSEPTDLLCNITNVTNTVCSAINSGSISMEGSGGQPPYQYSLNGINYQNSNTFNELGEGLYTISIRDDGNCVVSCEDIIVQALAGLVCEISEVQNAKCGEGNGGRVVVTASGSTAPYQYSVDGQSFQPSNVFEDLNAGLHEIIVKDVNNCTTQCFAEVGMDENILPTVFCEENVINLNCDPPVIPDGNALILLDLILADDEDGTAVVQVIDESISNQGCQYTSIIRFRAIDNCGQATPLDSSCTVVVVWTESENVTITCPDALMLSCGDVDNPMHIENWLASITAEDACDGPVVITNTYKEDGFEQGCSAGTGTQIVTFTAEDNCGNTASCSAQIEILDDGLPELSDRPEDLTISKDDTVPEVPQISASDECSTAEVTFSQDTTAQICGYAIERTWTATDVCGNTDSHTQRINIVGLLLAEIQADQHIICIGEFGAASVSIVDGTEPFTYEWTNRDETASVDNLGAGSHSVTITDGLACTVVLDVNISDDEALRVDINIDAPIACDLFQLGTVFLDIIGGSPDYTVEWSDGSTETERSELIEGTYSVTVTDSNGCEASAETQLEETATCTASISGSVWEDMARDGIRDVEDQVVEDMVILLIRPDGTVLRSARSDTSGIYIFSKLPPREFRLKAEIAEGFGITSDAQGDDNQFNNSSTLSHLITVADGQTVEDIDLGIYRLGKISGSIVWNDNNQNGILDEEEQGLFNAWVKLLDENQEILASTFSDEGGHYSFINLPPGTYYVEFDGVESLSGSPNGQGDDPSKSSQADQNTGLTPPIEVRSGDCYENVNAGFFGVFDLELSISSSNTTPADNELIAFSILIENNGDIDAENISVEVRLGTGIRNPISIFQGGIANGDVLTWEILSLASNKSITLAFRAEVSAFDVSYDYETVAEITGASMDDIDSSPGNYGDGLGEDDEDSVITSPVPLLQSDLRLSLSLNNESPSELSTLVYTIRLENHGPDDASGIEIVNYLPVGQVENINNISSEGVFEETQITWFVNNLPNGEALEMSFEATVMEGLGRDDIVNAAEIKAADQYDPNSIPDNFNTFPAENDEAISIASVNKIADLELHIVDEGMEKNIGETVQIVINFENKGLDDAAMARVVNYMPIGLGNVKNISHDGVLMEDMIMWTVYDFEMNGEMQLTFEAEVMVVVDDCDAYLNIAEVMQSSAQDPDSEPGNQHVKSEDDDDSVTIGINQTKCVQVNARVLLEGAYMKGEGTMHNILYQNGYLPGQNPQTFFGKRELPGQPYYDIPWEYCGEEGDSYDALMDGADDFAGYPDNTVDWVLISLRQERNSGTVVCRKSALVMDDGEMLFMEGFDCCGFSDGEEYYIVVEHRNHLPIMSPRKVGIVNGTMSFDFTAENSFIALLGSGQKEVDPGVWAMIAGNGEQMDYVESGDVNVNDLSKWSSEEGENSGYYFTDFDLNGDVNVQDKGVILRNFGVFSDVNNR